MDINNVRNIYLLGDLHIGVKNNSNEWFDIQNQFGTKKLKKYPTFSLFDRTIYYRYIHPIKSHRLLYYIDYNKEKIKEFITKELDWKDYGGKHFESQTT